MSDDVVHLCPDCWVTYPEPTVCEINGASETIPIPKFVMNEWDRHLKSARWQARKFDADVFSVRLRLAEKRQWHVRVGRYEIGWWDGKPGPWEFRQYPHGKFARATFGGNLRELGRRVRRPMR